MPPRQPVIRARKHRRINFKETGKKTTQGSSTGKRGLAKKTGIHGKSCYFAADFIHRQGILKGLSPVLLDYIYLDVVWLNRPWLGNAMPDL
jgi:hypothetical protein